MTQTIQRVEEGVVFSSAEIPASEIPASELQVKAPVLPLQTEETDSEVNT